MSRRLHRRMTQPIREGLTWEQLWLGPDQGLIACWERGRQKRADEPELAHRAERGELPVLAWKGGVDKPRRDRKPIAGTLEYLATWQGLRGEDLDIPLDEPVTLTCSRTQQQVIYSQALNSTNDSGDSMA